MLTGAPVETIVLYDKLLPGVETKLIPSPLIELNPVGTVMVVS